MYSFPFIVISRLHHAFLSFYRDLYVLCFSSAPCFLACHRPAVQSLRKHRMKMSPVLIARCWWKIQMRRRIKNLGIFFYFISYRIHAVAIWWLLSHVVLFTVINIETCIVYYVKHKIQLLLVYLIWLIIWNKCFCYRFWVLNNLLIWTNMSGKWHIHVQ